MNRTKDMIRASLHAMQRQNEALRGSLRNAVSVTAYSPLVYRNEAGFTVWTNAFQTAIDKHEIIMIPGSSRPYYIDATLVIPSGRRILAAPDAQIRKVPTMDTVLLRNKNVRDGSRFPIAAGGEDENISVSGGIWEDTDDTDTHPHGKYDAANSMPGLNACFFFDNVKHLNVSDATIIRAGGFGIQIGNTENAVVENIRFEHTVADGVHLNGNIKNAIVRNISGTVGDDIVAFNMYDWQRSSICFGPIENVLCENIRLDSASRYKAIRILPGRYFYDDGGTADCAIRDVIIQNVRGVSTFKFYFQTPPHPIGQSGERGEPGTGDNLFIEDVEIALEQPIDLFEEYERGDPVFGSFAGFEFGSCLGRVELKDIKIRFDKEKYPTAYLACIGPKSVKRGGMEIFDPHLSSSIGTLVLENIEVNGERLTPENVGRCLHEIRFENGGKPACGTFGEILFR